MTEIAEPPIVVVEAPPHRGTFDRVRARGRDFALVPAIIVLLVVGSFVDPVFLTRRNLTEVLQQQTEISLLVLGEALILFLGRIDLSIESMVGFAPALAVMIVTDYYTGLPGWTAIPICLLLGLAGGLLNGLLIVKFKLSAFIVTLGHADRAARAAGGLHRRQEPVPAAVGVSLARPHALELGAGVGGGVRRALRRSDLRHGLPAPGAGDLCHRWQCGGSARGGHPHRPHRDQRVHAGGTARRARRHADRRPSGIGRGQPGSGLDLHRLRRPR